MRNLFGIASDIFAILLLVWISIASILLNNTGSGTAAGKTTQAESTLPTIKLPNVNSKGTETNAAEKTVILSATKDGTEMQYYIDEKPVVFQRLAAALKAKQADTVRIRFDRQIPYGDYIRVLDLCKEVGVKNIANVYTTENLGK